MNSSGIKRGLAGSAITALAIAGLPLLATSASAAPVGSTLAAGETDIYSLYTGTASVRNDGQNQTVHLLAGGGANVTQVRFEYDLNGETEVIATVSRDANNAFSTEWAPPATAYGETVTVRAVGLNSVGTPTATADEVAADVSANASSVDIGNAPGSTVGVFQQPYGVETQETGGTFDGVDHSTAQGVITGTTSGTKVDLVNLSQGGAAERPATLSTPTNGISTFRGTANFAGYTFATGADAVNQAVVGADTDDSDDAEVVDLEQQTIANVTAVAQPANVPTGSTSTAVITVTDQDGNPVAGAQVIADTDRDGVWDASEESAYTDANGQASFDNLAGSAAGETYDFFVNTTGGDDYEPAIDFRRSVTVNSFAQTPTTLELDSNDGAAFDSNEYTDGDVTVTVTDQNGDALPGQAVSYSIAFTPEPTTATPDPATQTTNGTTAVSNSDGEATIQIPAAYLNDNGTYVVNAFINQDGTPGQGEGDLSADTLNFTAGDSTLAFDGDVEAAAGTTATATATLELFDGTPLAGRDVRFTYSPSGDDVVVAAQANQPAGTTRVSDTLADDTTDADGQVQVALSDPANTPPRSELDGTLDADTTNTTDLGNAGEDAEDIEVNFVTDAGPEGTTVALDENNATGKPGVALTGSGSVTTDNPATPDTVETVAAPGVLVTLTLPEDSDAFFTDGTYEDGDEIGDQSGDLTSEGKTITVVSDGSGDFTYQLGVEGSDEFDDNGQATFEVTASIAGSNDVEDYDFSTANPLNGGDVNIAFATDQESSVVPQAPTTDDVAYDVTVTDQFGNPVGGATVDITADGGEVIDNDGADDGDIVTDFNDNVEFLLSSDNEDDVTPTGTWNAPRFEYVADGVDAGTELDSAAVANENVEGDGPTAEFYEVDFAESTFTLSQNGAENQPVGSTVIMTYTAVDQNGEPIELFVDFFRTGPDAQQDGEQNAENVFTGEDGQATYVFAGTAEGTATVTAIASEDFNGEAIPESQVTDTVSFGGTPPPPVADILLAGDNNGPKKDVVRALVTNGDGEDIRLFKIRGTKRDDNRRLVEVRNQVVPEGGNMTFKVRDANGKKKTRFVAKIRTDEGVVKSNTQKLR